MKLIKIKPDHFIIVDDSEIKVGDFVLETYINGTNSLKQIDKLNDIHPFLHKKITHSTKPLGKPMLFTNAFESDLAISTMGLHDTVIENWGCKKLSLSEVKELIGEVDVEKKVKQYYEKNKTLNNPSSFKAGYNQAIEDNKDKKYTRKEVHSLMCKAFEQGWRKADVVEAGLEGLETDIECAWILTKHDSTPKQTEWEVIFDEKDKLKLK